MSGSEDCMTVNIFRQKPLVDGGKVPVAVYIHGGAFNRGSGKPNRVLVQIRCRTDYS